MSTQRRPTTWWGLLAAAVMLSACSAPTAATSTPPAAAAPIDVVDSTGATVTIESTERIVPVDGDLTEIVFALGLGDQVVATDLSATYPPAANEIPRIGYQRALNPEPIAAADPTVVLATDLAGPPETLDALRSLGIPVVVIERSPTLDGPADKIRAVADALGVSDRGEQLATAVTDELDANLRAVDDDADAPRVAVLYLRGESTQLLLGSDLTISAVLDGIGAINVGAELGIVDHRAVTAEALLLAAPDVLLVTTSGLDSVGGVDGLLSIPGIAQTPAGEARRVLAYEDQYLLGGGPRTGELATQLALDLSPIPLQPSGEPSP